MAIQWFYSTGGERKGPVSAADLQKLATAGQLLPTDLVWKEGMDNGAPAGRVKGLFSEAALAAAAASQPSAPPPPPVPAVLPSAVVPQSSESDDADDYDLPEGAPAAVVDEFKLADVEPVKIAAVVREATYRPTEVELRQPEPDHIEVVARQAKDAALSASTDAFKAFKVMAKNPVGGMRTAFDSLGPNRAMAVGLVFGAAFALCILVGVFLMLPDKKPAAAAAPATAAQARAKPPVAESRPIFVTLLRLILLGLVPLASATAGCAAVRSVFRGQGSVQSDVFIAGSSLLPCGVAVLVAGLLWAASPEVACAIIVFALTTTILMMYSGCTTLQKIPDAAATLAVPLMLIADLFACQIILRPLWGA